MKNQLRQFCIILFVGIMFCSNNIMSQVTGASIKGSVNDNTQQVLSGATVKATHQPSGTVYGVISNKDGLYTISGMRVGGPYNISVSYIGYGTIIIENIYLRLGEADIQNFTLSQTDVSTQVVTVTSKAGSTGQNSGTSTQITSSELQSLPTLDRNFNDFLRLSPQSSGYSGGTTFAGVNNRYNAIYIDGAINNDVFGLASSGTNGGQTGISPFSLDILDQLQVVVSPYDITLSGFAGGGVNAVTKSGTNTFYATFYQFTKNQNFVGQTNGILADRLNTDRSKVDDFTQRQYGFSASGPVIENKLFFFTNVEVQNDNTPVPFNVSEYTTQANRASIEDLNRLKQHLIDTYNYDPGNFGNTSRDLEGIKFFGKLNYNINQNHQLVFRHQYTKAEQYSRFAGNTNIINFSNNGIYFPSTTNSSAIELNSVFGNKYSNNLILSFVSVRDNRSTLGKEFPYVRINDGGNGRIEFGSEQFSTANVLDQDIFSLTNNFRIYQGSHTITIGTHNEFYNIYNLFLRQNFGYYEFNSIDAFINGDKPTAYFRTYALQGDGAADFSAMQLGLYAQDEWRVSQNFTITGGLRIDVPIILDNPVEDTYFNNEALPKIQQKYNIANDARAGKAPDGQVMFSPRIGFNYLMEMPVKTVIRGGAGIFTSRIPFVWPGAMFTNNGLTAGGVSISDVPDNFTFNPDPFNQITNPNAIVPSGQMDLFVKDFKYPQVFRTSLGFDFELPYGIFTTIEGIFTKTINNILYTNVNTDPDIDYNFEGSPDNRPVYKNARIDNTYDAVYLASNTSEGYTYNLAISFAKNFEFGLNTTLAYAWSDAKALSEGTSSQNSSQWRGQVNINGRNHAEYGRSDFAVGHRILSSLSYTHQWENKKLFGTTFALFINGQSGTPFSYVIGGSNGRNINRETGSTSNNRSLVYIPASRDEINLVEYTSGGVTVSADEQWERLDKFIEDDPYLSKNRGKYAEKNAAWAPFSTVIDLSLRQDIGINLSGQNHRFQISLDIFNFTNLLNNEWGTVYTVRGDFNNYELYNLVGYDQNSDGKNAIPKYTFTNNDTGLDKYNINDLFSRWRMQLGFRYIFN